MQTESPDVLIIGAGPTGLTLACLLARSRIDFRIIDAVPAPPTGSRGKGLQPRSLELFDDLGVADQIIALGRLGMPMRQYDETGAAMEAAVQVKRPPRPDAPYWQSLILPQWRVEEVLRGKLEALGGHVEFDVTLTGLTQDDDGVTATVSGPAGASEIKARWLAGCDGGKSTIRHLAGIAFLGETLETHRMLVGDFRVPGLDREHWHIWRSAEGFLGLCPLPSTASFQFQASIAPGLNPAAVLENYQDLVQRRSGRDDIMLADPGWMSLWRANIRMVDRYRAGRVFLAGDAAHVHSPAGGQGMNTGVQDAFNLGWKLAAVLGGADASLLDSYQAERLPIAAWVLGISTELMQSAAASGTMVFNRDEKTLQLGLNYRESALSAEMRQSEPSLRAGDRAPDAPGLIRGQGECHMFDLLRGPEFTLLGFGAHWWPVISACTARFADKMKGYVIAETPGDIADAAGHARAAYGDGGLFVVRPDNYLGLATDEADPAPVIAYLAQFLPVA